MKCIFLKYYNIFILHFNELIKGFKEIKSKSKKNPYRLIGMLLVFKNYQMTTLSLSGKYILLPGFTLNAL
jgi:hypothetical protein